MLMKTIAPPKVGDYVLTPVASRSPVGPMAMAKWLRIIGAWYERGRQRRALASLDDRMLGDVGIARSAAAREIAKPFWR